MAESPLVSICCLSFNHAPYIKDCIEGFLCQETNFGVEILIHDDASTDGTDDIIRAYAEKYPDLIFPLFETENKYSNGYKGRMDIEFNYSRARGKYIATCEGDDYWTDPLKLQKQVDFLESHPEYSVCFHRCTHLNTYSNEQTDDLCGSILPEGQKGTDITIDAFFEQWVTQPLTMVFRHSVFSPKWRTKYKYYRDMHEIYNLLKVGKGYLFAFYGGIYRFHEGGVHSMISSYTYYRESLPIDRDFYLVTKEEGAKRTYCETLQVAIFHSQKSKKLKAIWYTIVQYSISGNFKCFIKNIHSTFRPKK